MKYSKLKNRCFMSFVMVGSLALAGCAGSLPQINTATCMQSSHNQALGGLFSSSDSEFNKECGEAQGIAAMSQVNEPKIQEAAAYAAYSTLSPSAGGVFDETVQKLGMDTQRKRAQAKVGQMVKNGEKICIDSPVQQKYENGKKINVVEFGCSQ